MDDGIGATSTYRYDAAGSREQVSVRNQLETSFSMSETLHIVGRPDGSAWIASVEDPQGHMVYGPYTYAVQSGPHTAAYRISIDNNSADNDPVAIIDVADGSTGAQISSRTLYQKDWRTTNHYEIFELAFTAELQYVGRPIEFRVFYLARARLRVDRVGFR